MQTCVLTNIPNVCIFSRLRHIWLMLSSEDRYMYTCVVRWSWRQITLLLQPLPSCANSHTHLSFRHSQLENICYSLSSLQLANGHLNFVINSTVGSWWRDVRCSLHFELIKSAKPHFIALGKIMKHFLWANYLPILSWFSTTDRAK